MVDIFRILDYDGKVKLSCYIQLLCNFMSDVQLNRHYITIRKRTIGELFDLTMAVFRTEGLRILAWFSVFVVPLLFINHALLLAGLNHILVLDREESSWFICYVLGYVLLVLLETPFASSFAIIYLGKRVFAASSRPNASEVLVAWVEALPQLFIYNILLVPLILLYDCMPEIVALERSPLFRKSKDQITTFKRLRNFHRDRFGEQCVMLMPLLMFSIILIPTLGILTGYLFYLCVGPISNHGHVFLAVQTPIICWAVTLFMLVFHFLRYIDMRIEREGWDVELVFRAERSRMTES